MSHRTNDLKADPNNTSDENKIERGAPVEHFHGERTDGERVGDPGDLEEETLDRDAPFNKTYELRRESSST